MNLTNPLAAVAVVAACALGPQETGYRMAPDEGLAATYENLATAIISINATETSLVKEIVTQSYRRADDALASVPGEEGTMRRKSLELAAQAITDIATEGDKRIQAVRQRLLKAGHHHHTDADTQEDYIIIDSAEKKTLLDLARRVAQMTEAPDQDVRQMRAKLSTVFATAMNSQ